MSAERMIVFMVLIILGSVLIALTVPMRRGSMPDQFLSAAGFFCLGMAGGLSIWGTVL